MALPLLFVLNKLQRAALPMIKGGVARGLSTRVINTIIKDALGSGINRNTLLRIINAEKGIKEVGTQLKFLRAGDFPNVLKLPQAVTRIRRKFSFVVRVRGIITGTEEAIEQHITISTDAVMAKSEIERIAEDFINDPDSNYPFEFVSSLLIEGTRAGELGTL